MDELARVAVKLWCLHGIGSANVNCCPSSCFMHADSWVDSCSRGCGTVLGVAAHTRRRALHGIKLNTE